MDDVGLVENHAKAKTGKSGDKQKKRLKKIQALLIDIFLKFILLLFNYAIYFRHSHFRTSRSVI